MQAPPPPVVIPAEILASYTTELLRKDVVLLWVEESQRAQGVGGCIDEVERDRGYDDQPPRIVRQCQLLLHDSWRHTSSIVPCILTRYIVSAQSLTCPAGSQ